MSNHNILLVNSSQRVSVITDNVYRERDKINVAILSPTSITVHYKMCGSWIAYFNVLENTEPDLT